MRKLRRTSLPVEVLADYQKRAQCIQRKRLPETRKATAHREWKNGRRSRACKVALASLIAMNSGQQRCMYCEYSEAGHIDHFRPRSLYPLETFSWANHLLACAHCNSNFKRDQFPVDERGAPLLLDPTDPSVEPHDHLILSPSTGIFEGVGNKGQPSIEVFGLNRDFLVEGRKDAFVALQHLLVRFAQLQDAAERDEAAKVEQMVRRYPYQAVLQNLLSYAQGPGAVLLSQACRDALKRYPEILSWVP